MFFTVTNDDFIPASNESSAAKQHKAMIHGLTNAAGYLIGGRKQKTEKKGMYGVMTETENRVALVGIIVEDSEAAGRINGLLHEYGSYIIGRMGIPYRERRLNVISVVLDAPQGVVSALSGKLGMIPGVTSKCIYGKG